MPATRTVLARGTLVYLRRPVQSDASPFLTALSSLATPLVALERFARGAARIFAKLEWFNPGGSLKDRIARAMILDAERRGQLRPGGIYLSKFIYDRDRAAAAKARF